MAGAVTGRWHKLRAVVLVLAGLAIATLGFFDGLDRLSTLQPAIANSVPSPLRARVDRVAAHRALSTGDIDEATRSASAALRSDPMERRNLGRLGLAHFEAGNRDQAEAVFRQASQLGWRDSLTQFFWFEASLRAADLPAAMVRLDALMRATPNSSEAQRALAMVASSGPGRAALAELLLVKPDWLRIVMDVPAQLPVSRVLDRAALAVRMGQNGALLGCDQTRVLADRLLDEGQWNAARQLWNIHCPDFAVGKGLVDPAFASLRDAALAGPFGWRLEGSGDLYVATGENGAIAVRNTGPRRAIVASQQVAWAPGLVRLRLSDTTPGLFAFALRCSGAQGRGVGYGPLRSQGDPAVQGQQLAVPDCRKQTLDLLVSPTRESARLGQLRMSSR